MDAPIPGLRESLTFAVAVSVYQRHPGTGTGVCAGCGQRAPCPARRNAASVIVAAGDDPRRYDAGAPGEPASPPYTGYRVGGRSRRVDEDIGYFYDRDRE